MIHTMKKIVTPLFYSIVFLLSACNKESIRGEGPVISEERNLPSFTQVQLDGDAEATISYGSTQRVSVSGYQNLLPVYETKIVGGVLHLGFKSVHSVRNNNIRVSIELPQLNYLRINGSGKMTAKDFILEPALDAFVNGSGELLVRDCKFNNARYSVNGSGTIGANTTEANIVDADIHGSGQILLQVSADLNASIAGSGTIDYWGNPGIVNSHVSGSGRINKK